MANGYRFTIGTDLPERRGGDCGWQMGVKDRGGNVSQVFVLDSKYNYRAVGTVISTNPRVTASDPLLNRPFTAVARGLIAILDADGVLTNDTLPFVASSFTGVMTASEFVRPEPFTSFSIDTRRRFGTGGCIDCDITASFITENVTGTPAPITKTVTIFKTQCPQKTLSGAVAVPGMGAIVGETTGAGLLRVLQSFNHPSSEPNNDSGSEYAEREPNRTPPLHRGGTFVPSGQTQFTGKIDTGIVDSGGSTTGHLLVDIRPNQKVDLNNPGSYSGTIAGLTKIAAISAIDTDEAIAAAQPDLGTLGDISFGRIPVDDTAVITVDNCTPCNKRYFCEIETEMIISGWSLAAGAMITAINADITPGNPIILFPSGVPLGLNNYNSARWNVPDWRICPIESCYPVCTETSQEELQTCPFLSLPILPWTGYPLGCSYAFVVDAFVPNPVVRATWITDSASFLFNESTNELTIEVYHVMKLPNNSMVQTRKATFSTGPLGSHKFCLLAFDDDVDFVFQSDVEISTQPIGAIFPYPSLFDFSTATIKWRRDTGIRDRMVGYQEQYQIVAQNIVMTIDEFARWLSSNSTRSFELYATAGVYEVHDLDTERLLARYKLAGFPDTRWSRNGANQMQLVSADWSVEEWPVYITVEPV